MMWIKSYALANHEVISILVPEMQQKLRVTVLVSDVKRVEKHPDFDQLARVIQDGLQGFIAKNHSPKWR